MGEKGALLFLILILIFNTLAFTLYICDTGKPEVKGYTANFENAQKIKSRGKRKATKSILSRGPVLRFTNKSLLKSVDFGNIYKALAMGSH